jgi:hypothetical protein
MMMWLWVVRAALVAHDARLNLHIWDFPLSSRSAIVSTYQWGAECSEHFIEAGANILDQLSTCIESLCLCQRPSVLAK